MRKMQNSYGSQITVVEHIILKNGWEYYVTDDKFDDGIMIKFVGLFSPARFVYVNVNQKGLTHFVVVDYIQ
jgi:hypothetical protein